MSPGIAIEQCQALIQGDAGPQDVHTGQLKGRFSGVGVEDATESPSSRTGLSFRVCKRR